MHVNKPHFNSNSHVDQNLQNSKNQDDEKALIQEQQEVDSRFKLLEKLGEGTYGVVYKAYDSMLDMVSISSQNPITRFISYL